jgi:glycosyltransferase involved in cell wall biosynthesis
MGLSVLILTKNEEKNIKRVIESVKDIADEIVVLDSGSTDRTVEIAKSLGAKGIFPRVGWISTTTQ